MEKKAVIWDMDGILADTAPFHLRAWQQVLQTRGKALSEEGFRQTFGMRNDDIIRRHLGNLPPAEMEALSQEKEERFRQAVRSQVQPFPGVMQLLQSLSEGGFLQAVASSAPSENVRLVLEGLQASHYFQAIVSGDEIEAGKPNPEVFLRAAQRLGVQPRDCLVIEDARAGVMAAKAAGMKCVAVTNTSPAERLNGADLVVSSLEEVSADTLRGLLD
jgi:beta-phosphoglucomutase family hydrolase